MTDLKLKKNKTTVMHNSPHYKKKYGVKTDSLN